jgi:hypothetical protein
LWVSTRQNAFILKGFPNAPTSVKRVKPHSCIERISSLYYTTHKSRIINQLYGAGSFLEKLLAAQLVKKSSFYGT